MARFRLSIGPVRPTSGQFAGMVGAAVPGGLDNVLSESYGLPLQLKTLRDAIRALADQTLAINTILRQPLYLTVDSTVLPFITPGGVSGDIQVNDGADGLAGLSSTGTGNAVRATSPVIITPTIADLTNANHTHLNAAGGGLLTVAAIPTGTFAQEAWTNVSTFANSWVDGALSGDAVSGFRKDRDGNVWARGSAKNGVIADNTTVFTLPSGYRPTSNIRIPVTVLDVAPAFIATPAILRIDTSGVVSIFSAPVGTVFIQFAFSFPTV